MLDTIPPLWMRLLGSRWATLALFSVSAIVLYGLVRDRLPLEPLAWAKLGGLCFGPALLLIVLRNRLIGSGSVRCPECRKLTRFAPRPDVPPGASEPHLRCNHCGSIIWGM